MTPTEKPAPYTEDEDLVDREIAAGTSFPLILWKMHQRMTAGLFRKDKAAMMGVAERYGHTTVNQPHMGLMRPVRVDICSQMHGVFIQHILSGHIHDGLDAVFEIGTGAGIDLVSLAARHPQMPFYGGELAAAGRRTVAKLAAAAGLNNVTPVAFNIFEPDFSAVAGKDVLIYSNFVLVYANPFPRTFFPALLDTVKNARILLFEPVSFALESRMTERPLFPRTQAKWFGFVEDLWEVISELQQAGRVVIEEVVPDISGRSGISPITLLRLRKAP